MKTFKPVKQGRISEEITQQIKNAILKRQYEAGQKLPSEKELCEQFQVSRGVIREAIRTLEITGFIELRQGAVGGSFVRELSSHAASSAILDLFLSSKISLKEVLQVRAEIEAIIVRSISSGISPESIAKLKKAYLNEQEALSLPYPERIDRQLAIHYALAELSDNRLYRLILTCLLDLTKEIFLKVKSKRDVIHDPEDHMSIIKAISSGDKELAEDTIRDHLDHLDSAMDELERLYRKSRGV